MSSWFNSLKESATAFTESAVKATEKAVESISHATTVAESPEESTGGSTNPKRSNHNNNNPLEMLQKLTLSTPELTAERQRIDQEEARKEAVRDQLAGLLPWETRDPERDILVDECRDVILQLSHDPQTFYGPWAMMMPGPVHSSSSTVTANKSPTNNTKNEDEDEDSSRAAATNTSDSVTFASNKKKHHHPVQPPQPSAASLEQLDKLQPLPKLLGDDFDLDSHVGLIQKCLLADPHLVHAQSQWSTGGGVRETIFWKNYFFHCAYSRYEAGLSVDEVWSPEAIVRNDLETQQALLLAEEEAKKKKKKLAVALPQAIQAATASVLSKIAINQKNTSIPTDGTKLVKLGQEDEEDEHEITFGGGGGVDTTNKGQTADGGAEAISSTSEAVTPMAAHTSSSSSSSSSSAASPTTSDGTSAEYDMMEDSIHAPKTTTTTTTAAAATTTNHNNKDQDVSKFGVNDTVDAAVLDNHTTNGKDNDNDDDDDDDVVVDYEDPELDELEAEIARELED
ncbi:hypothetical protein ACA910_015719 [Epithemia clementina (nom. ined.)]